MGSLSGRSGASYAELVVGRRDAGAVAEFLVDGEGGVVALFGLGVVPPRLGDDAEESRVFRTAVLVAISCCVLAVQVLVVGLAWGFVAES